MKTYELTLDILPNPYPLYARMRAESPVARLAPQGSYILSRYADVAKAIRDFETFSSTGWQMATPRDTPRNPDFPPSIVEVDPPYHKQLRALVSRAFTPRVIAGLEGRIRQITIELVDAIARKGEFELLGDLSIPLPMIVIAELLGVQPEHRDDFKRWSDDMINALSLVQSGRGDQARRSTEEMAAYLDRVVHERQANPRDDLVSDLLRVDIEGTRLTYPQIIAFANTLLIAGNETTTSLLGNTLAILTDRPALARRVWGEPALIPQLVEESLRFYSPAQTIFRRTLRDVTVGGETIPQDALVLLLLSSANRDSAQFPDGDTFDLDRDTRGHLAFGLDIHFCLGAALARLEGRVVLEELVRRLPPLRRVETEIDWTPSFFIRSPRSMRLALD